MAEESDLERTEPASERRLEQAREDGNVPHSRELMAFMVLATGAGTFWVLGEWMAHSAADLLRHGLSFSRNAAFDSTVMSGTALAQTADGFGIVGPIFLAIMAAIIATPFIMGGWIFSSKAFQFDLTRMDPIKGFGRMFSWQSLAELMKAILKALLIGGVLYWVVRNEQDRMFALVAQPIEAGRADAHHHDPLDDGAAAAAGAARPVLHLQHRAGGDGAAGVDVHQEAARLLLVTIFPTVLLVTTLLRLSLNVASTRVILLEGHTGGDAAGKVIEAFGHFLVGGNYAVGLVVFVILVVINFVVITKGAGRIAEVSARFTLDAMPGKQMAIDADLNAGLIGEDVARKRRTEIAQEADFFGSMDGASKFVRGDAVAGILILFINIIGGLVVGVLQHDMEPARAAQNYTLLTIGDGLVAQIPALIISTAAGLVVSRVATDEDIGQQFVGQVFSNPQVLMLTAGILGILGLIPGMPHFAFLLLRRRGRRLAYWMVQRAQAARAEEEAPPRRPPAAAPAEAQEASWADVAPVDVLGLEVGYRLIPLVDKNQDGELLKRIRGLRKKFAQEVGFLSAPVHIRDNLELRPNGYRILLKGVEIGAGEAWPGMFLAINPGRVSGAHCRARRPRIRPSACRRYGSMPACATRRMCSATRWSTPAR
jgi:hypothetical protein